MASTLILIFVIALSLLPNIEANRCAGRPDGQFINDFSACDAYFSCVRGIALPGRCPFGFYFNEQAQKCDNPWKVVCLICPDPNPDTEGSGVSDPNDPADEGPVFVPITNECRKYTLCLGDVGFLRECAAGLKFDSTTRRCDLQENVSCEEIICPNNINPSVPTFVPDPKDCARYYICHQREPISETSLRCVGDLLFNPKIRQCDLPENVECEDIVDPPLVTECQPTGLHYIPEADSCSSYFVCMDGHKIGPLSCAGNLIFDINTMTCRPRSDETQCITDEANRYVKFLGEQPKSVRAIPYSVWLDLDETETVFEILNNDD